MGATSGPYASPGPTSGPYAGDNTRPEVTGVDSSARDHAIELHPREDGCFFCATDAELTAGLAGKELPRTLHMQLPFEACPFMNEES